MQKDKLKATRQSFTLADRKLISGISRDHPEYSHLRVAEEASKLLERQVNHKTAGRILKDAAKWLASTNASGQKRDRKPKWENLESRLLEIHQQVVS